MLFASDDVGLSWPNPHIFKGHLTAYIVSLHLSVLFPLMVLHLFQVFMVLLLLITFINGASIIVASINNAYTGVSSTQSASIVVSSMDDVHIVVPSTIVHLLLFPLFIM